MHERAARLARPRRARGASLAAALLLLLASPVPAGAVETREAIVPRPLQLRATPHFGSAFRGDVVRNERVVVLDEVTGWVRVRGRSGEGWVRAHQVDFVAPRAEAPVTAEPAAPAAPAGALDAPAPKPPLFEPVDSVDEPPRPYLRAPDVVGSPATRSGTTVLTSEDSPFLGARPQRAGDVPLGTELVPARTLHLRSAPDWAATLVGRSDAGRVVRVVDASDQWTRVEGAGVGGWVRTAALTAPPLRPPWSAPLVATTRSPVTLTLPAHEPRVVAPLPTP